MAAAMLKLQLGDKGEEIPEDKPQKKAPLKGRDARARGERRPFGRQAQDPRREGRSRGWKAGREEMTSSVESAQTSGNEYSGRNKTKGRKPDRQIRLEEFLNREMLKKKSSGDHDPVRKKDFVEDPGARERHQKKKESKSAGKKRGVAGREDPRTVRDVDARGRAKRYQ